VFLVSASEHPLFVGQALLRRVLGPLRPDAPPIARDVGKLQDAVPALYSLWQFYPKVRPRARRVSRGRRVPVPPRGKHPDLGSVLVLESVLLEAGVVGCRLGVVVRAQLEVEEALGRDSPNS
jgi:hypothetical protein